MKRSINLFFSFLFVFTSSITSQTALFDEDISVRRGDTVVLDFFPSSFESNLQGAELHLLLNPESFSLLSVETDAPGLDLNSDPEPYNFTDTGSIWQFHFIWLDQNDSLAGIQMEEGQSLLRLMFLTLQDADNVNEVLSLNDNRSYFAITEDGNISIEESATLLPGDGTVSVQFLNDRQFSFEALRSGKMRYSIFQMDGRLINTTEMQVHKGDNIVSMSENMLSNLRWGQPYILSVFMDGLVSSKTFIRQ